MTLKTFADWLAATPPSHFLQNNEAWAIPAIQTIHIVGIGIAMGSAFMLTLRVVGVSGMDQTLLEAQRRYLPWLTAALLVLLGSGALLILAEPAREFFSLSFRLKMLLVAFCAALAVWFGRSVNRRTVHWEERRARDTKVRVIAATTLLLWIAIIFLGRFIAYDNVWGSWSPAAQQG
jgi:Ca2+/Na+ antiporter